MSTPTWQDILHRGEQTVAVWETHAPAFKVGDITLAMHEADLAALPGLAQGVEDQQEVVDDLRDQRDTPLALIKDLGVRLPRKLDGELAPDDPWHDDLTVVRNVEMDGMDTIVKRGKGVLAVWEKFNARQAAATPPKPALTVGGKTAADLDTALTAVHPKSKAVEKAISLLRDRRRDLRIGAAKAQRTNVRWYAAWQGEFLPGTPEHDALGQIDTGSGGGNGEPAPPQPPTDAPLLTGSTTGAAGSGEVSVSADALPAGATGLRLYSPDAGGGAPTLLGESTTTTVTVTLTPGEPVIVFLRGFNAGGEGPESDTTEVTPP